MRTLKTRSHHKPATQAAAKARRAAKARPTAKAKSARKVSARKVSARPAARRKPAASKRVAKPQAKTVSVTSRRVVLPVHRDETTITLGPHTTNHHMNESAFRVHPGPTMHPVGPMAMKHPRATLRHH